MKTNKWFTLVELVVVIGILSILSTIWFLSYSNYSITARDTKRQWDITIIGNSLKKLYLQWADMINFVSDNWNSASVTGSFFMKWADLFYFSGSNYKAWDINLISLIDVSKNTLDPKTWKSYKIWVYESSYDLAATLEDSGYSYIMSSTQKRTSSGTVFSITWTIDITNNMISLKNSSDALNLQIWDIIFTWWTATGSIDSIIWDDIYISWNLLTNLDLNDNLRLYKDDTNMIWNILTWVGINCENITDLSSNVCPISDSKQIVPYKIN